MKYLLIISLVFLFACNSSTKYEKIERPQNVMIDSDSIESEVLHSLPFNSSVDSIRSYKLNGFEGYRTTNLFLFEVEGCTYMIWFSRNATTFRHFAGCKNPIHQHQYHIE